MFVSITLSGPAYSQKINEGYHVAEISMSLPFSQFCEGFFCKNFILKNFLAIIVVVISISCLLL